MKKLALLFPVFALLLMGTASCNDDDDKLDPNLPLYQDYLVENVDGEVTAYAYFSAYNSKGQHMQLNNGASIKANGEDMSYIGSIDLEGFYDYSHQLPANTTEVTYVLKRNANTTLTNIVNLAEAPDFKMEDSWKEIKNGVRYEVTKLTEGSSSAELHAVLVSPNNEKPYQATIGVGISSFTFTGVRPGTYSLMVSTSVTRPVAQTDGTATGKATAYRIYTKENVKVTD